jgi:hypothetical protein
MDEFARRLVTVCYQTSSEETQALRMVDLSTNTKAEKAKKDPR